MPKRSLLVRSKVPFSSAAFDVFCAGSELISGYANKLFDIWHRFESCAGQPPLRYQFGAPYLNEDLTVAAVDIDGEWTHLSRHLIEVECAIFLWRWLPHEMIDGLEYGRTEEGITQWWPIHGGVTHAHLDPEYRKKAYPRAGV